jgi:hypothetical protein
MGILEQAKARFIESVPFDLSVFASYPRSTVGFDTASCALFVEASAAARPSFENGLPKRLDLGRAVLSLSFPDEGATVATVVAHGARHFGEECLECHRIGRNRGGSPGVDRGGRFDASSTAEKREARERNGGCPLRSASNQLEHGLSLSVLNRDVEGA